MSIEQKIAQILAESNPAMKNAVAGDQSPVHKSSTAISRSSEEKPTGSGNESGEHAPVHKGATSINAPAEQDNEANKKNDARDEDEAAEATSQHGSNPATRHANAGDQTPVYKSKNAIHGVKEDIDALMAGEDLSEEFRAKAETIFEAAVMARVKAEVARIEEEFESKLAEAVAKNTEGLVEQVDGYLGYVAEQWMAQNEIALERGIKSDILEGFVSGLKDLFQEHYIEVPEEKFDVLGEMESTIESLEEKLNEQVAANVELTKVIAAGQRSEIVKTVSEGLTDTETEKFNALVEELTYEDAESFETKVKTIRENYFTPKAAADVKSVVTDAPVETLTEEKKVQIDPQMSAYLSVLNKNLK
mgnify:CR=1 FL=1